MLGLLPVSRRATLATGRGGVKIVTLSDAVSVMSFGKPTGL